MMVWRYTYILEHSEQKNLPLNNEQQTQKKFSAKLRQNEKHNHNEVGVTVIRSCMTLKAPVKRKRATFLLEELPRPK